MSEQPKPPRAQKKAPAAKVPVKKASERRPNEKKPPTSASGTAAASAGGAAKKPPGTRAPAKKAPATVPRAAKKVGTRPPTAARSTSGAGSSGLSADEVRQSRFFKRAQQRAEQVLGDPEQMRRVAVQAADKSKNGRSGPLSKVLDELSALIRLTVAYARGHYREVSGQSMLIVVAGLIYFVSPVDLVPDFLPGGYLDDVAVLGWVIRTVRAELDAFMEWETGDVEV